VGTSLQAGSSPAGGDEQLPDVGDEQNWRGRGGPAGWSSTSGTSKWQTKALPLPLNLLISRRVGTVERGKSSCACAIERGKSLRDQFFRGPTRVRLRAAQCRVRAAQSQVRAAQSRLAP
jgi:hypothetical protein